MQAICRFFPTMFPVTGVSDHMLDLMAKAGEKQPCLERKELECQYMFTNIMNGVLQD